ncbi:unnamed protein product [Prorocentrum cordatum]|uniref:Reverse transcriptase domain-containing protein n=1 Tax=Prorocentrum cordatum TaxID=2364126 RepID=A0ABN9VCP2_9DINO|nr:unnamed protein product [Polarella glacialis]
MHELVTALNQLDAGDDAPRAPAARKPSLVQQLAMERFAHACAAMGSPGDLALQAALRELRGPGAHGDCEPVSLAPLSVDLLSLPAAGAQPRPLADLSGRGGKQRLCQFFESKVLPKHVAEARRVEDGFKRAYLDPLLRRPDKYAEFLSRLSSTSMIDFTDDQEEGVEVGLFAVGKKNGRQRLIIDARASNSHFSEPDGVALATGAALSSIELGDGANLFVSAVDIQDAFYQMELPPELRKYFHLPRVQRQRLREAGVAVQGGGVWARPRMAALPMGWAHALALRQQIHESALEEKSGLDPRLRVADGRVLPPLREGLHAAYVDNFLGFGDSAEQADAQLRAAQRGLAARGLRLHEPELAAEECEQLGWRFDGCGGVLRPKMARLWRLRPGALELIRVGFAGGRQVERVVGHFTFAGLARRPALSVFDAVYSFCARHRNQQRRLPASVVRELRWAVALLPLISADLRAPWLGRLYCCDASEEGRGVVERDFDSEKVAEVGRRQERWKYRQLEGGTPARPREVLEEGVGEKVGSERFEDVPIDMVRGEWRVVSSGGWERSEGIATLEGRSLVHALRHALRDSRAVGRRILWLTDSMTATLSLGKGRSSASGMMRVARLLPGGRCGGQRPVASLRAEPR